MATVPNQGFNVDGKYQSAGTSRFNQTLRVRSYRLPSTRHFDIKKGFIGRVSKQQERQNYKVNRRIRDKRVTKTINRGMI